MAREEITATEYLVIMEKYGPGAHAAYVSGLPGIGVAGKTEDEVRDLVADAIRLYLDELERDGDLRRIRLW